MTTANMDGFFLIVAGGTLPTQLAFQKVEDPVDADQVAYRQGT